MFFMFKKYIHRVTTIRTIYDHQCLRDPKIDGVPLEPQLSSASIHILGTIRRSSATSIVLSIYPHLRNYRSYSPQNFTLTFNSLSLDTINIPKEHIH